MWSGLGSKVADRSAALLLSPALAFWGGGILAWVHANGGLVGTASGWAALDFRFWQAFTKPTDIVLIALVLVALLTVAATAKLTEFLTLPTLRLLEGHWARWAYPVRTVLIWLRGGRLDRSAARWRELALRQGELSARERIEYDKLEARRWATPAAPTAGCRQRWATCSVRRRAGRGTGTAWRPWSAGPGYGWSCPTMLAEVAGARARLNQAAQLWLTSVVFTVWTVFTWWVLAIAAVRMAVAYRFALAATADYAILVQSCFDLHRQQLYAALGRELPRDTQEELNGGTPRYRVPPTRT
jgi:hypothetical protein